MTLLPGDTVLKINGETRVLRLTLGALAEIEQSIGGGDFEKLRERLTSPSVSDLLLILHALIAGGGERVALDSLKASDIDLRAAAQAIGAAFKGLGVRDCVSNSSPACGGGVGEADGGGKSSPRETGGQVPQPPSALRATSPASGGRITDAAQTGASPPKREARRSPGKRGSAPESSQ